MFRQTSGTVDIASTLIVTSEVFSTLPQVPAVGSDPSDRSSPSVKPTESLLELEPPSEKRGQQLRTVDAQEDQGLFLTGRTRGRIGALPQSAPPVLEQPQSITDDRWLWR